MINVDRSNAEACRRRLPLCRNYLLVHFQAISIPVQEQGATGEVATHWGLGVLADGQREVVGAWIKPSSDELASIAVFEDLRLRGVERIRFVVGIDPTRSQPTMRGPYPSATALPTIGELVRKIEADLTARDREAARYLLASLRAAHTAQAARAALVDITASPVGAKDTASASRWGANLEQLGTFFALAPRLRRIVRDAEDVADQLERSLRRVVRARHCFPNAAAAASFVADTLIREEGNLRAVGDGPRMVNKVGVGRVIAGSRRLTICP